MKDALIKLLKVKSIVTIVLTAVFSYLAVTGFIEPTEFLTIFTIVIGFYFGIQAEKSYRSDEEEGEK